MSARRFRPTARVAAPLALLAGVGVAVLLFAHQRRPRRPDGDPVAPSAPAGGAADAVAEAAAKAHAAAGVVTGSTPNVTAAYEARLHALRTRVAAAPDDRERVMELARLLHDGHRSAEAVDLYRKAITLDPEEAQPYYDLASVHAELGRWDLAADVLGERLDRDTSDAVARYDLAAVRANQGRTAEATRLFEEARETATDGALRARISDALARLKGR